MLINAEPRLLAWIAAGSLRLVLAALLSLAAVGTESKDWFMGFVLQRVAMGPIRDIRDKRRTVRGLTLYGTKFDVMFSLCFLCRFVVELRRTLASAFAESIMRLTLPAAQGTMTIHCLLRYPEDTYYPCG
jgi:hypothetical protein